LPEQMLPQNITAPNLDGLSSQTMPSHPTPLIFDVARQR
jgi:hypothetical protein